ncbi:D-glycero-beta-D-manno-heptose-7-phosphate kinase [Azotosporobacter soli]|uniref:D-glycero-beta-D-manno-heptose-7-phosphate kinase n=1 Tax=Azotosporobacter soli TaxID=3055040 RepID=UPI0031FEE7FA
MQKRNRKLQAFAETKLNETGILVVGDVMLDKYYFGEVKRISPEAPVPVTRVIREKGTLGGAANVAHNLARLGCATYLCGVVGSDHHRQYLQGLLDERGIDAAGLVEIDGPTTTKLRIIGGHQQMMRLDFEETTAASGAVAAAIVRQVEQLVPKTVQCVILSDYAKGVCTPDICQRIIAHCNRHNVPVVVDPKGTDWRKYEQASYITPNLKELNEALGGGVANEDEEIRNASQRIRRKYKISNVLVTRSEKGLSLIGSRKAVHIPTYAQEVFDVSGAGDTVIAVLAAAIGAGANTSDAAYLANLAAGVVVGKVGTYAISLQELLDTLERTPSETV